MDVRGLNEANKEVEGLKKLMRDRENSHATELEGVRESNKKAIESLKESQADNLDRITQNSDQSVEDNKQNYDDALKRTEDHYEKTLHRERHENYDRLGKLQSEQARKQEQDYNIKKKQIDGLMQSQERDISRERTNRDAELNRLRTDFNDKADSMRLAYKEKLDKHALDREAEVSDIRNRARQDVDRKFQESADDLNQSKRLANARTKMVNDELLYERDTMRKANMQREQEITKEHGQRERALDLNNQTALETAKARQDEAFIRTNNDQNFMNSFKDGETTRRIAEITHNSHVKEQRLKNQLGEVESAMKKNNEFDKVRAETQKDLDEKRHRQEIFLNTEAVRQNAEASNHQLSERYQDVLGEMKAKQQAEYESQNSRFQKQLSLQDQRNSTLKSSLENEKSLEVGTQSVKHATEKERLVRRYEQRQNETEELRKRQLDEQAGSFHHRMKLAYDENGKDIYKANRENTMRLFNAREAHKQSIDELELRNKFNEETADANARNRIKRVTDNYNRSVNTQQENFSTASNELRDDANYRYVKLKHDSDQERRLQLIDIQMKNRAATQSYENKLSEQKDNHENEIQRLKMDHDKQTRDSEKRNIEAQERERAAHKFELETKDRQLAEKLKLQEEAFRQQIASLKRSHELTIKKG